MAFFEQSDPNPRFAERPRGGGGGKRKKGGKKNCRPAHGRGEAGEAAINLKVGWKGLPRRREGRHPGPDLLVEPTHNSKVGHAPNDEKSIGRGREKKVPSPIRGDAPD